MANARRALDGERVEPLSRLDQPQEVERSVEHPDVALRRDHRHGVSAHARVFQDVAFVAEAFELGVPRERRDLPGASGGAGENGACRCHAGAERDGTGEEPREPPCELLSRRDEGRRVARSHELGRPRSIRRKQRLGNRLVT
jgi:hypothetical protein